MFQSVTPGNCLRFDVVSQVLSAIFRGQIRSGDRLIATRLANEFGVSATPAREALLELANFGVVELLPNKGAIVGPLGPRQIEEIYFVRNLLESEATRMSCGRIPVPVLQSLRERTIMLMNEGSFPEWKETALQADVELHELVVTYCGIERLSNEIERYGRLVRVAQSVLYDRKPDLELAQEEHLNVIDALLAEQPRLASQRMSEHISSACRVLIAELFSGKESASSQAEQDSVAATPDTMTPG